MKKLSTRQKQELFQKIMFVVLFNALCYIVFLALSTGGKELEQKRIQENSWYTQFDECEFDSLERVNK